MLKNLSPPTPFQFSSWTITSVDKLLGTLPCLLSLSVLIALKNFSL